MRKTFGLNKHQKAAHKVGERKTSSAEIEELLEMSCSADPDERLTAAEHLCPCHVRKRIDTVWEALYRMMEDSDRRVRQAAWHTIEDGGMPGDAAGVVRLERLMRAESDVKVRTFAEHILSHAVKERQAQETALLHLAGRPQAKRRGKCDFCGAGNVPVDFDPETPIPNGDGTRPALICVDCAR